MIVTNGIIGICILLGGLKYKELGFQSVGTTSLLSVLAVLAVIAMILPNFTTTTPGPTYSPPQLIFVSTACLVLYGALVWAQTRSHKAYFEPMTDQEKMVLEEAELVPSNKRALLSFVGLLCSLAAVVGLAKILSPTIESTVAWLGAPKSVVGITIALLVLAPETFAAAKAAKINQLQTSLNLALGSGAASIALTIPAVSLYSLSTNRDLGLGLDHKSIVLLVKTFLAIGLTFSAGRTTALHGAVHIVILLTYLAMSFLP
jgi:Ca2+:H+ antiporter